MTDRRRINGPPGGTAPPVFEVSLQNLQRPQRTRTAGQPRRIFLKTGLTPSASGSAYLELEPSSANSKQPTTFLPQVSTLKITCAVHGPRPLPRSFPFSSQLILTTHVKFAPFAARHRRGFIRDASERDLGVHLEAALRGVIIADRWPKSGVEVIVTILEAEEDGWWADEQARTGITGGVANWGMMTVLAGCITAASAAISAAGIDCVDLVLGGVAAIVKRVPVAFSEDTKSEEGETIVVVDPSPAEHNGIIAGCVVGYLASRDEVTELWVQGDVGVDPEALIDQAVQAAVATRTVLTDAVIESALSIAPAPSNSSKKGPSTTADVEMSN